MGYPFAAVLSLLTPFDVADRAIVAQYAPERFRGYIILTSFSDKQGANNPPPGSAPAVVPRASTQRQGQQPKAKFHRISAS